MTGAARDQRCRPCINGSHDPCDHWCPCGRAGHPQATRNEQLMLATLAVLTRRLDGAALGALTGRSADGTARTCAGLAARGWVTRGYRPTRSGFRTLWRITDAGRDALAGLPPLPYETEA